MFEISDGTLVEILSKGGHTILLIHDQNRYVCCLPMVLDRSMAVSNLSIQSLLEKPADYNKIEYKSEEHIIQINEFS